MLSSMLLDYRTMYDPEFVEMMRDFFALYNGRRASTEDFRRCVEEHVGMDMGWFFDEWVYGTEIPTYHFGWGKSVLPDGGYQVQGTVRQSNVSPNFKMYATVRVDFADGQYAHFRVLVSRPEEKFTLRVPMEPHGVHFNDLNSVLAEVEER
jgi:aminopeptidase N